MYAGYTNRYLSSFILLEAYCVGTVQQWNLGRIIVMVYYSKLDNTIC